MCETLTYLVSGVKDRAVVLECIRLKEQKTKVVLMMMIIIWLLCRIVVF